MEGIQDNKKGFVLITVLILSALLLLFASGFVFLMVAEKRISTSQLKGTMTYYLAEAGISKAIWKLKNDPEWKDNFENDSDWEVEFTESDVLFPGDSYQVEIKNSEPGRATITSIGLLESSQRIVKAGVFKPLGKEPPPEKAIFSNETMKIWGTNMSVNPGSVFSNEDIDIKNFSNVNIENAISAVGEIEVDWSSSLEADEQEEGVESIQMAMIDFDSDDPSSYKNQANNIYSSSQFKDMLRDEPDLTINGITYVTGKVQVKRGQHLTINGVLVADGNIEIGTGFEPFQPYAQMTVNWTAGQAAGLLTKGRIWFGNWAGQFDIQGLLYALDRVDIVKLWPNFTFELEGGIIARQLNTATLSETVAIRYNQSILGQTIGQPGTSPLIAIEHWEEEY